MSVVRAWMAALAMIAAASVVRAQTVNVSSADWMMQGCRAFISDSPPSFRQGACSGAVGALIDIGQWLPDGKRFCTPAGSTRNQMVRVVVAYIDRFPARLHESFAVLAIEAMHRAWPC